VFAIASSDKLCQVELICTGDKVNLLCEGSGEVKPKAILTKYVEDRLSLTFLSVSLVGFVQNQIPVPIV
jgi:hypothetical protein